MASRPNEELNLERPFDNTKRIEKGNDLAALHQRIIADEAAAKAEAKAAKEAIDELKAEATQLAREIRTGKHVVPVMCRWLMDTNAWSLIADDTGEVVRTTPVTEADRQAELNLS